MRLSELQTGETGVIVKILGHGAFRKRMIEMGFVKGRPLKVVLHAPLRDPIKYMIMGYEVSLRTSEAQLIEVVKIDDPEYLGRLEGSGVLVDDDAWTSPAHEEYSGHRRTINVALIGNPNSGKTSLFNIASGAREHVGNYSGVTVDAKSGKLKYKGYTINLVDLPGTYSLTAYSPEELYVRRYLKEHTPDVIINVVVASNLERNMYLTTQLIDMDRSMVIALNMYDELRRQGVVLDEKTLGRMIGVPMVPVVARTGEGIDALLDTVISVYEGHNEDVRHIHVSLGKDAELAVDSLKNLLKSAADTPRHFSPRYLAIKLLERDPEIEDLIASMSSHDVIFETRDRVLREFELATNEEMATHLANEKYGFIAGALAETMTQTPNQTNESTRIIDAFVTNKLFGFPLFFLMMFAIFWLTFSLGAYPQEWIEDGVAWLSGFVNGHLSDGPLKDLIVDGVLGGVGGVIVFLPNILILYFCISFMEDSGYMSRAAFIMDKVMHRIGLHGKSFIPLVMGFGCNVPAILASRSIESRSSRIITILINPFMSCSARLPVYVLLVGTFFSSYAAIVFMGLYILGILAAVLTAKLLRRFYFKKDETPFVMELPPYRVPTFKALLRHMWGKGQQYLRKMGGIILFASIIVWALNYFPLNDKREKEPIPAPETFDDSAIDYDNDSYLEMMGKAVTPIMEPLGFHWRATVAALAGIPAKEIVVSTLGVLYANDDTLSDAKLGQRLSAPSPHTGSPDFTSPAALAFMVFILLYCPCMATVTAISRECGSWKYGLFTVVYNTLLAWVFAFITYRIALLI